VTIATHVYIETLLTSSAMPGLLLPASDGIDGVGSCSAREATAGWAVACCSVLWAVNGKAWAWRCGFTLQPQRLCVCLSVSLCIGQSC